MTEPPVRLGMLMINNNDLDQLCDGMHNILLHVNLRFKIAYTIGVCLGLGHPHREFRVQYIVPPKSGQAAPVNHNPGAKIGIISIGY